MTAIQLDSAAEVNEVYTQRRTLVVREALNKAYIVAELLDGREAICPVVLLSRISTGLRKLKTNE